MTIEQAWMNYDLGEGVTVTIDLERKTLSLATSDPEWDFTARFHTVQSLETAYRERIGAYLARFDCFDTEHNCQAELVDDLVSFAEAEATCQRASDDGTFDDVVAEIAAHMGSVLRRALKSAPVVLEDAVFYFGDDGIQGVYVNPPAIASLDDEGAHEVIGADRYGAWLGDDFRAKARWNFESNPLHDALAAYGNPRNLFDPVVAAALYLACAKLEAEPGLGSRYQVGKLRVLFVFQDAEGDVDFARRQLARDHLEAPASAFFAAYGLP